MITLTNGLPQGPDSLIVPNGSIGFQLNVDATVIAAPYGFVSSNIEVVFQLDANGNILPNAPAAAAQIYSNAELQPQNSLGLGTYYLVTIRDQNGANVSGPMWWQFPEAAGSTVNISYITPISTVGGNVIFYPTNFAGDGTVTSVAFVGDGVVLSATPSTAVTTSGNISATLLTQSAGTVLAGPTSGPAATPTFRALVASDIPAGTIPWNNLANATGALTLANTTFGTTFNQTSAVTWEWANITAATNVANQNSPILEIAGTYWTGSASALDGWKAQDIIGAGTNPTSTLMFTHTGSSGQNSVSFSGSNVSVGGSLSVTNLITAVQGAFAFFSDGAGSSIALTSVASSVGALATYQATIPGGQPTAGMRATVTGFVTHTSNNGYFIVQSSTASTIVLYNSSAVSETHAATAVIDTGYINQSGYSANLGVAASFSIQGTGYTTENGFENLPNSPIISLNAKGDAEDAGYLRILSNGSTGVHGLEIGAIIDGSGTNPITIQLGDVNAGAAAVIINAPLMLTGATPTGGAGQLSLGTTTGFGNGSAGTTVTTTTKSTGTGPATPQTIVSYLEVDLAGTKYWLPLVQ